MSIVCITGHPGTGKSTLLNELTDRGYVAYGLDEVKAASYFDLATNQPSFNIPNGADRDLEWRKTNVWKIDMDKVKSLPLAPNASPTFIFCNGYNVEDVWKYSDTVIILQLNPGSTYKRLTSRTNNSFGSHPGELELAIEMGNSILEKTKLYKDIEFHYIDASKGIDDVVSEITNTADKNMLNDSQFLLLSTSANNKKVYYDPIDSHTATHFKDTPQLRNLVETVIQDLNLNKDTEVLEHDFQNVIGKMDLIETTDADEIIYAKRVNRGNFTRFVLNKEPVDTSYATLILNKKDDSSYILHSAWIGRLVPSFPGSETETPESKLFWRNHALVWGNQDIQPNTETNIQPW